MLYGLRRDVNVRDPVSWDLHKQRLGWKHSEASMTRWRGRL